MKRIVSLIYLLTMGSIASAQHDLADSLQEGMQYTTQNMYEAGNCLYYLRTIDGAVAFGDFRALEVWLIKRNKYTYQTEDSVKLIGDLFTTDSIVSRIQTTSSYHNGRLHYLFTKLVGTSSVRTQYLYYIQADTQMQLQVPARLIETDAQGSGVVQITNQRVLAYYYRYNRPTNQINTAAYHLMNLDGSVIQIDSFYSTVQPFPQNDLGYSVSEIHKTGPNELFLSGFSVVKYGEMGGYTCDTNMMRLDTFLLNSVLIVPSSPFGYLVRLPNEIVLPTGGIIGAGPYNNDAGYRASVFKLQRSNRYKITYLKLFDLKDATDHSIGFLSSVHSLDYNRFDNRVYYAVQTHSNELNPLAGCSGRSNYLQIIGLDTVLNTKWIKYIASGSDLCAEVDEVRACSDRPGVLISGKRRDYPYNGIYGTPFLYRIDSSGSFLGISNSEGFELRDRVKIWPSPATTVFNVNDLMNRMSTIQVVNANGQVVANKTVKNQSGTVSVMVEDLPAGVYVVMVRTEDGETVVKRMLIRR